MMVGISFQKNLFAIYFQTKVRRKLYRPDTKTAGNDISNLSVLISKQHFCCIQIWIFATPQMRSWQLNGRKFNLIRTTFTIEIYFLRFFVNDGILIILNPDKQRHLAVTCIVSHLSLNVDILILRCGNIQGVTSEVELRVCSNYMNITEQSSTCIPS